MKKEPVIMPTTRVVLSKPTNNTTNVKKEPVWGEKIRIKTLKEIQRENALKANLLKYGQNNKKEDCVITESAPEQRRIVLGKILVLTFVNVKVASLSISQFAPLQRLRWC